MCTKFLQIVNSAFFGIKYKITDIRYAIAFIGLDTLKSLILAADIFSKFTPDEMKKFQIQKLYEHSLFVSSLSKRIILSINDMDNFAEISIMSGLLHDIGKLIFIKNMPEEYLELNQKYIKDNIPLHILEKQTFNVNHAEAGAYLLELWGMQKKLSESIFFHHNPDKLSNSKFTIASSIYIANNLGHEINKETVEQLNEDYISKLKVLEFLPEWRNYAVKLKNLRNEENNKKN